MCGICGIYNKGNGEIDQELIIKMRDVMINRGPDDAGLYVAPHIGLGHRRLSIIDLSPVGHQPMCNEDGTIWIVFNGEIYNFPGLRDELIEKGHTFQSRTDTEILIHGYEEWGLEGLLKKINGMFAMAIWDAKIEELVLIRDRLGVKPLFYMEINGKVYFSSDIKSIWLGYDRDLTINHAAIDSFLFTSCISQEYSIFKEVKKVPPAHYIKFNKKRTLLECYWFLSFAVKEKRAEEEFVEEIRQRLFAAVKQRMISDVPLGAFLSGGIDSGLVVALMAMASDLPVKTFSIGVKDESYNELKYARLVAEKYSTDHHEFIVEPDAIGILPEIVWSYGEPFSDSSQIPTYYVAKMTRQHVTVALTGDGGDEAFGGYGRMKAYYLGSYYRKYIPSFLGNRILPRMADGLVAMAGRRGLISKIKTLTEYGMGNFSDTFYILNNIFGFEHRDKMYSTEFKHKLSGHTPVDIYEKYSNSADGINEVDKRLYIDIKNYLSSDILTKVDVATMMNSLEARSPFLDYQLMEYSARIPYNIKLKFGVQKYLLKKLAEKLIPHDIIYRKKQGFSIPLRSWLIDDFKSLIRGILFSDRAIKRGYFEMDYVKVLVEEHLSGRHDHSQRIWALMCLELWHLMFIDRVIGKDFDLISI